MSYKGGKIGKYRSEAVLIDVDGVLADFENGVRDLIEEINGVKIKGENLFQDLRNLAGTAWDEKVEEAIKSEGFAQTLKEYPGSVNCVKEIMENNEVIFVTAPYPESRHWFYDRYLWLRERFGIDRDDIIFARDKRWVQGKILIDDRVENVLDWSAQQNSVGILMSRPWNRYIVEKSTPYREFYPKTDQQEALWIERNGLQSVFLNTNDWDEIQNYIRNYT